MTTRVLPPKPAARATGAVDALLDELGYPMLAELDDEAVVLVELHDELFEEVAAIARRGWACAFDAETGCEYSADEYEEVLARILRPVGIQRVSFDDERCVVTCDGHEIQAEMPAQDDHGDDWLDVGWIMNVANLALAGRSWRLLEVDDWSIQPAIVAVVPELVWNRVESRDLAGSWRALDPIELPDFN